MGQINLEIPDGIHKNIRQKSSTEKVPMKILIIEALREAYGDSEMEITIQSSDD